VSRYLWSLRGRFVLSHILPLLIIIPILGIALVYILETEVLLRNMSSDLTSMATLIARLSANQTGVWSDPAQAQTFVDRASSQLDVRMLLFDRQGRLLASSDPADAASVGRELAEPGLPQALAGQDDVRVAFSPRLSAEVVASMVPVVGAQGQVLGVVRLTHPWVTVYDRFLRLRYLIVSVLAVGMLLGSAVGMVLALNLEHPLAQLTRSVGDFASRGIWTRPEDGGLNEVRLLANTVNDLVERLRELERGRRQLLANLVHELGRPLASLSLAVEALEYGADQDVALRTELLAGIRGEITRLRRLLDDLARLYDQAAGTLQIVRRPTPLNDWFRQLLPVWRTAAQSKGLQWADTLPDDLPIVEIDPDRLGQAVGNLLSNAIRYTPANGHVCVEAGCDTRVFWLDVGDTGPGIPIEEQARVFEPFQRGADGQRFPQGMGLGLTIARDLVAAHGGHITLQSRPDLGTHFTIYIPLWPVS